MSMPEDMRSKFDEGQRLYCELWRELRVPSVNEAQSLTYFYYFFVHSGLAFEHTKPDALSCTDYTTLANNAKVVSEAKDDVEYFMQCIFVLLYGPHAQAAFSAAWKIVEDHVAKEKI